MTNLIINEAKYNGGLFPKIPERMNGQDTLLVTEDGIVRKVDEFFTTKDIRKGHYSKVVRISTMPFFLDVKIKAVSKNKPYEFDIVIGVEARIIDSEMFFSNRNSNILENSISSSLSRIIIPIAKSYELTDEAVDEAILTQLRQKDFKLETLGIVYTVHSADAEPDSNAAKFVKQMTDSTLNTRVEQHKASEAEKLTARDMESAIMRKVTEGELSMKEALEQLSASNRKEGYNKISDTERLIAFVHNLQEKNLITDDEAGQHINEFLRGLPAQLPKAGNASPMQTNVKHIAEKSESTDTTVDDLLWEEEKE